MRFSTFFFRLLSSDKRGAPRQEKKREPLSPQRTRQFFTSVPLLFLSSDGAEASEAARALPDLKGYRLAFDRSGALGGFGGWRSSDDDGEVDDADDADVDDVDTVDDVSGAAFPLQSNDAIIDTPRTLTRRVPLLLFYLINRKIENDHLRRKKTRTTTKKTSSFRCR